MVAVANFATRGAVLIDETNLSDTPRLLFYLEHSIHDGRRGRDGNFVTILKQLQFVETDAGGSFWAAGPAPYLDYRARAAAVATRHAQLVGGHQIVRAVRLRVLRGETIFKRSAGEDLVDIDVGAMRVDWISLFSNSMCSKSISAL